MKTLVISDLHLNPRRQGGTTLESREALEEWQLDNFEYTLSWEHDLLIIAGDLFDSRSVSEKTMLRVYNILKHESKIILLRGNHDSNSMKYGEICSLELLCNLLPNCTLVFDKPYTLPEHKFHFIPHCFNQQEFDEHIYDAPDDHIVFLHANYDNHFAVEADHSLNIDKEQCWSLIERGCKVIMGHEHTFNVHENGPILLGCTLPTSIADCLGGDKRALMIENGEFTFITTWSANKNYLECDYSNIHLAGHKFIRVTGECKIIEYPEVVRKIAALRKKSDAFIIGNNVKVQLSDTETVSLEDVTNFNIIELLLERVEKEFRKDVKSCV